MSKTGKIFLIVAVVAVIGIGGFVIYNKVKNSTAAKNSNVLASDIDWVEGTATITYNGQRYYVQQNAPLTLPNGYTVAFSVTDQGKATGLPLRDTKGNIVTNLG